MALVATLALVFLSIVRPMEFLPWLEGLRLLDVFTALAAIGVAIDIVRGRRQRLYSPQLPFLLGFLIVSYASTVIMRGSEGLGRATTRALLASVFMLVVMYGASTVRHLRALLVLIVACSLFIGGVAIHQGLQEPQCIEMTETADELVGATPDGRSCLVKSACYVGGRPDVEYECERIGLFATSSIARRVRWRGQLGDPNDLAVFIGAVIPFLLATATAAKKRWLSVLAVGAIGLELVVVILTKSRGGQLMIGVMLATLVIGRHRKKGILAALLALPVLLLGGRAGESADSSADERTDLLYDGFNLVVHHPVIGLGLDGFQEELRFTAHNSYLLAAAELGLPGMFCWTGLLWASMKIAFTVARHPPERLEPQVRLFAGALVVSLLGMSVGVFFLSYTFKHLLFVWLGLCGALYASVQSSHPDFRVRIGVRDCVAIAGIDALLLCAIFVYTRLKA